ncbi:MAG: hypothetical protein HY954_09215 [Deltaproteobacteria bacterium]|nr:hypothetical protein [Deltaproteobacteria bacterium]
MNRKKILLISYAFPPSPAVGGVRMVNFARNLPAFGFDTWVLTVKEEYIENADTARLGNIEGIRVIRTSKIPKITGLYTRFKRRGMISGNAPLQSAKSSAAASAETRVRRVKRFIKSFMMLPDGERNWLLPAVTASLRVIRKEGIDCVLTTCPPYTAHMVGLALKKIAGVKWIADFRDPWMIGAKSCYPTCGLSIKIEKILERQVFSTADMTLFNTINLKDAYKKKYPFVPVNKLVYVPNSFDKKFFAPYRGIGKYERFTISYTGSMYMGRTPEPVLKAIRELIDSGKARPGEIRMNLAGDCGAVNGRTISELVKTYGLDEEIEVSGTIPYSAAIETVGRSHLALLLAPSQPYQIPAKVYDYIGVGTPVLALTGEGATADFINATGAGKAFNPDDITGIKDFIYGILQEGRQPRLSTGTERLEAENTSRELASHIRGVVFEESKSANPILTQEKTIR